MAKSGWCVDEIMAVDLGDVESAKSLHNQCPMVDCGCEQHSIDS